MPDANRGTTIMIFYYERNLPEILSKEEPKAAEGDVNGDGLLDVPYRWAGEAGQLYLSSASGAFIKKRKGI